MRWRTASAEWAVPLAPAMAAVKKYFNSKVPRGVAMYLFEVTRLTVDSCISISVAMSRNVSGFMCSTPLRKKASCWRSEEHTSELQSLMRISYAVFCLKNKQKQKPTDE